MNVFFQELGQDGEDMNRSIVTRIFRNYHGIQELSWNKVCDKNKNKNNNK